MEQSDKKSEHIAVSLNLRIVMMHAIQHDADINNLMENRTIYVADNRVLIANFGILILKHDYPNKTITVTALGKTVWHHVPGADELDVFEPGAWMDTLLAIRHQLEERFGPVQYSET
jgi:hypothetical protein